MKINKLLILTVIPMMCLAANVKAQDNTPKKGDITVAATVGYNSYTNITAPSGLLTDYEIAALSTNWTDKKIMIGFEGGLFLSDDWKLNLGGGFNFTKNPGYSAVPGTFDKEGNPGAGVKPDEIGDGSIPNYRAVGDGSSFSGNVYVGIDRYFRVSNVPNLMYYMGGRAGFAYSQDQVKYDEPESMGKSVAEAFNIRGAFTFGVDYYILPGMFIGCQVDPVCYTYNTTTMKPQEGLGNLSADSHNISLLAAPTIKIGFKF